jgi:hypothetical protein
MATQPPSMQRVAPPDDLYTTLLMIASGLLLVGIVYLLVRSSMLYGTLIPPAGL